MNNTCNSQSGSMKVTFLLDRFTDGTLSHVSALLRGPGDASLGLTSTTCTEGPLAKYCLALEVTLSCAIILRLIS